MAKKQQQQMKEMNERIENVDRLHNNSNDRPVNSEVTSSLKHSFQVYSSFLFIPLFFGAGRYNSFGCISFVQIQMYVFVLFTLANCIYVCVRVLGCSWLLLLLLPFAAIHSFVCMCTMRCN